MSETSSRTYLNTYTLVPVAGQPGLYTIDAGSGASTVTDIPTGPGDDTTVLGDVPNDRFTAAGTADAPEAAHRPGLVAELRWVDNGHALDALADLRALADQGNGHTLDALADLRALANQGNGHDHGGNTETYSGYGVGLFPSGDVALEGPVGVSSDGTMTLYTESTIACGTVIQLQTVEPGSQNEWNLGSNSPTAGDGGGCVCFMAGTAIRTPAGEIAVESLHEGDLIMTADGATQPIRWIGRQTISMRFADPLRVGPIRVKAGALGPSTPSRDLLLSPDHALLVDGLLVQAGALVNGRSVVREAAVPETFTYYHVELAEHALILAEGATAETFVDNVDRLAFDNWSANQIAGRDAPSSKEMAHPRAKSYRQVPLAVRERIEARADELFGLELTKAA